MNKTYETPSVDLAGREFQQHAHGWQSFAYSMIVPRFAVNAAVWGCYVRPGHQHWTVSYFGFLNTFARVNCYNAYGVPAGTE